MPCEHTDTFSHIPLLIMPGITLSTFPFIWKVPSPVRDACREGGDSEGHEMCQDRIRLAPALCCGQPWPGVRESEWKWANHRPRSLPRVLVSIPTTHCYSQSRTNGDYSRGFLPSLHGSMRSCCCCLGNFLCDDNIFSIAIHVKGAATYIASAPATIFNNDNGITAGPDR